MVSEAENGRGIVVPHRVAPPHPAPPRPGVVVLGALSHMAPEVNPMGSKGLFIYYPRVRAVL